MLPYLSIVGVCLVYTSTRILAGYSSSTARCRGFEYSGAWFSPTMMGTGLFFHPSPIVPTHSYVDVHVVYRPLAHAVVADLEWKVIYVGSAEDTRYDQVLEEVDVGPIPIGVNKFVLTAGGKRKAEMIRTMMGAVYERIRASA